MFKAEQEISFLLPFLHFHPFPSIIRHEKRFDIKMMEMQSLPCSMKQDHPDPDVKFKVNINDRMKQINRSCLCKKNEQLYINKHDFEMKLLIIGHRYRENI